MPPLHPSNSLLTTSHGQHVAVFDTDHLGFLKVFVHRVIGLLSEGMTIAGAKRFVREQRKL